MPLRPGLNLKEGERRTGRGGIISNIRGRDSGGWRSRDEGNLIRVARATERGSDQGGSPKVQRANSQVGTTETGQYDIKGEGGRSKRFEDRTEVSCDSSKGLTQAPENGSRRGGFK